MNGMKYNRMTNVMNVTLMTDMETILTKIGHSLNFGKNIYRPPAYCGDGAVSSALETGTRCIA